MKRKVTLRAEIAVIGAGLRERGAIFTREQMITNK